MAIQKAPSLNYLTTATSPFLNPQRPFTLMMHIRHDAISITNLDFKSIMGTYTGSPNGTGWEIRAVGNGTTASMGIQVSGTGGAYNDYHNDGVLVAGRWIHYAVAYDFNAAIASRRSSYLDGSPLTQGAAIGVDNTNIPNASGILRIGQDPDNATSFSGAIAYLRMFDGLLSQSEIIAEMRSRVPVNKRCPIIFDYPFDASGGNNVIGVDRGPNRLHVTGKTGTVNWDAGPRLPRREVVQLLQQDPYLFGKAGVTDYPGAVDMTAPSTLTVGASLTEFAAVAMTAPSTLSAAAVRTSSAAVSMTAPSALAADAGVSKVGAVAMTAPSTLDVAGDRTTFATVAMTAPSTLAAVAVRDTSGAVAMTAPSTLTAAGIRTTAAAVDMTAPSILSVSAVRTTSGAVAMTAPSVLVSDAQAGTLSGATMTAPSVLTVGAFVDRQAAVSMTAPSGLAIVTAALTEFATVSMTASSTLAAAGVRTTFGAVDMTAPSTLTVATVRTTSGAVVMTAPSTLTVAALVERFAAVSMTAPSVLVAAAVRSTGGVVTMTAVSVLTVNGVAVRVAGVSMSAPSTLTVGAILVQQAAVAMFAASVMTARVGASPFFLWTGTAETPLQAFVWNGTSQVPINDFSFT